MKNVLVTLDPVTTSLAGPSPTAPLPFAILPGLSQGRILSVYLFRIWHTSLRCCLWKGCSLLITVSCVDSVTSDLRSRLHVRERCSTGNLRKSKL